MQPANPQPVPGETTTVQGGETRGYADLDTLELVRKYRDAAIWYNSKRNAESQSYWREQMNALWDEITARLSAAREPEGGTDDANRILRTAGNLLTQESWNHYAGPLKPDSERFAKLQQAARDVHDLATTLAAASPSVERRAAALSRREDETSEGERAEHIDDWHEDDGPALWWRFPITEPPYVGTPLDSDWPGYHTHWTPILVPRLRAVVGTGTEEELSDGR